MIGTLEQCSNTWSKSGSLDLEWLGVRNGECLNNQDHFSFNCVNTFSEWTERWWWWCNYVQLIVTTASVSVCVHKKIVVHGFMIRGVCFSFVCSISDREHISTGKQRQMQGWKLCFMVLSLFSLLPCTFILCFSPLNYSFTHPRRLPPFLHLLPLIHTTFCNFFLFLRLLIN